MSADPPVPAGAPPTWRDRLDLLLQPSPGSPSPVAVVGGSLVVALVAGLGWLAIRTPAAPPAESLMAPVARPSASSPTTGGSVVVHAAGAVLRPGVYELRPGARVRDLLAAAGGPAADAEVDRLNLAAPLVDGSQVYVPRAGEAAPVPSSGGGGAPAGPLDLNTATVEQLDELPGVGPATAQAIVSAREKLGGFRSVDDLLDVRGIGPAKLEALRDLVTV
jgi:competence protein ComEA